VLGGIQILRACAALMVAALHIQHEAATLAARGGQSFTASQALPWLAGVDIFFVVSGFIMVHASASLFGRSYQGSRLFMARRLARIVPIYWLAMSLYLAVVLLAPGMLNNSLPSVGAIISDYLFWPTLRANGLVQPFYSLGWTLNYEMFFYLLFAVSLVLPRRAAVAGVALVLVALVAGVAALEASGAKVPVAVSFWSRPIILEFVLGMMVGLARAEGVRLSSFVRFVLAIVGIGVLFADVGGNMGQTSLQAVLGYGLPAACLVAAAGLGKPEPAASLLASNAPSILRHGLSLQNKPLVALGDASYALYLLHPFAARGARVLLEKAGLMPLFGPWGFITLALALAMVAAIAMHRLFEVPVTGVVRRWLRG
jgi:exopolysaccharide production protein ExoZ